MTYYDFFNDNLGIIWTLKQADLPKYNEIFGADYPNDVLDAYILFSNGNYTFNLETVRLLTTEGGLLKLGNIIWLKYYDSWLASLKTLEEDYINTSSKTVTDSKTRTYENIDNDSSTDSNKVFAYDSDVATDDSSNTNTSNRNATGTETVTVTHNESFKDSTNLMALLDKYKNYHIENKFCDIVRLDIIDLLCVSID